MTESETYKKLSTLPDHLKKEVDDFIEFLLSKKEVQKVNKPRKAGLAKGLIRIKKRF